MKASALSAPKMALGILALNAVFALAAFYAVIPALLPLPEASRLIAAALIFCFGAVSGLAVLLAAPALPGGGKHLQETADAFSFPVFFLSGDSRIVLLNSEAESVLGLSRDRDIGTAADPRILTALTAAAAEPRSADTLNMQTVFELNGRHYQVLDNPLPAAMTAGAGKRAVILRDVSSLMYFRDAVSEVNRTMVILNSNAAKISSTAVALSQGATEQASSLSSITASMEEFSKKIQGSTESAAKGTQLAVQAREAAERSGSEIVHALSAMTDVQDAGIRIARIVKLIDDIAFQTNLLALNAAVEAARAGRQGKGFAVVAEEVRNLAGRSARAAKDTAGMVEDVTERIGNASAYISKLEDMLRNIVQDAIRIADSSAAGSATSAEQASGILRVNQELMQMNSVTHSTMSAAEQTAAAVEVLSKQVQMLKEKMDELSGSFGLDDGAGSPRSGQSREASGLSINLLDDPDIFGPGTEASAPRSYLTSDDYPADAFPGFSVSRKSLSAGRSAHEDGQQDYGSDDVGWNLNPEADGGDFGPLNSLLQKDGYDSNYQNFLKSATRSLDSYTSGQQFDAGFEAQENDRIVKPNQNIQLDDSEFGRY